MGQERFALRVNSAAFAPFHLGNRKPCGKGVLGINRVLHYNLCINLCSLKQLPTYTQVT
jgi:hypothetical protein